MTHKIREKHTDMEANNKNERGKRERHHSKGISDSMRVSVYVCERERERESLFACLVGFLMSPSTTRPYRGRALKQSL